MILSRKNKEKKLRCIQNVYDTPTYAMQYTFVNNNNINLLNQNQPFDYLIRSIKTVF